MELGNALKGVFFTLMCAILMSTLYMVFFGDGYWVGVLFYASRQIEYPISKYYYSYCYLPNTHMEDGTDRSLGANIDADLYKTPSNLESINEEGDVFSTGTFSSDDFSHYSSGWY